jgi:gluconolactonase
MSGGTGPASGLLADGAELEQVATGTTWAEGPVWLPGRRAVRYSDIPGNRILEFSEDTGELSVYAEGVNYTNGRTLDLDGSVLQCSHGGRRVERDRDGQVTTVVDRYQAVRFTDPAYGILRPGEGNAGALEYGDQYVFRFEPETQRLDPVVIDIEQPNGLAFSPDERILYVADSSIDPPAEANPDRPGGHAIHAYDVFEGRHAKNGRPLVEVDPGLPDGFRVDVDGRLWTSSFDSVQVFSPAGELLERIAVPEKIANVCFGGADGRTLYITASSSLYRIRTTTTDAAQRW